MFDCYKIKVYIFIGFFLCLQMHQYILIFLILLAVCNQVPAIAISDSLGCIYACTHAAELGQTCSDCARSPPMDNAMCQFACGTMERNIYNIKYLDIICDKCFGQVHVMTNICWDCDDSIPAKSRVCSECRIRGF